MAKNIERSEIKLPTAEEFVVHLIRKRRSRVQQESAPLLRHELPALEMTPSLKTLFETPTLWTTVDGIRYIPDSVVRSLLFRRDEKPIDEGDFTSILARRKDMIEKKYGIRLLTVSKKQRHQYWNEDFVEAFFATLQNDIRTSWGYRNKSIYEIRDTVGARELFQIAATAREEVKYSILTSCVPFYLELLREDFGITTIKLQWRKTMQGKKKNIEVYY